MLIGFINYLDNLFIYLNSPLYPLNKLGFWIVINKIKNYTKGKI